MFASWLHALALKNVIIILTNKHMSYWFGVNISMCFVLSNLDE
jgi:hypothetical protein